MLLDVCSHRLLLLVALHLKFESISTVGEEGVESFVKSSGKEELSVLLDSQKEILNLDYVTVIDING